MMTTTQMVTDCCGRLLDAADVLVNDVHYIEMCPACLSGEGEHESHVTCKGECPGRDWKYTRPACDVCGERATHQQAVFSPGGSELMFYCAAHTDVTCSEIEE